MTSNTDVQLVNLDSKSSRNQVRLEGESYGENSLRREETRIEHGQRNVEDDEVDFPSDTANGEIQHTALKRADGGIHAWLFLAGCFTIEALVWGFPFSYGVFQDYYQSLPMFASDASGIAIIGTSASGILYLGGPFIFTALGAFPKFRRWCSSIGLVVLTIALISSSFSTKVWHLVLTQGVLYAVGGSMLYCPTILYLDEWFIKRKGMAFGVMWAGTGLSGIIVPFIMSWGLEKYGFRTMLRAWSITLIVLSAPLIYFVKPRIPFNHNGAQASRPISFSFLKTRTFWFLQASNILEGLGFFIPGIYLPSYARDLGFSSVSGSLLISLFNATSVIGQIGFGILIDHIHVTSVIMISTIGASISILLFWGLSLSLPLLIIFALVYGVFGGGFTSTWTGIIKEVQLTSPDAETGTVFGMLAAGRGIGAVCSGPISAALLGGSPWKGNAALGYGSGYGALIVFTGVSAMMGGLCFVGKKTKIM